MAAPEDTLTARGVIRLRSGRDTEAMGLLHAGSQALLPTTEAGQRRYLELKTWVEGLAGKRQAKLGAFMDTLRLETSLAPAAPRRTTPARL